MVFNVSFFKPKKKKISEVVSEWNFNGKTTTTVALINISIVFVYLILLTLSLIPKCIDDNNKKIRNIILGNLIHKKKKSIIIVRYVMKKNDKQYKKTFVLNILNKFSLNISIKKYKIRGI